MGYNDKYADNAVAKTAGTALPLTALDIALSIAQLVNTIVGRPMHVTMVNGLNKNLFSNITTLEEPKKKDY